MTAPTFATDRREALMLMAGAAILPIALEASAADAGAAASPALGLGRDQPFDLDWRFLRGEGQGLEVPGLDDSAWRRVDLPHDWSIEDVPGAPNPRHVGPFDRDSVGGTATGFTDGGEGLSLIHI